MVSFFSIRGQNFLHLLAQILFFGVFLSIQLGSGIPIKEHQEDHRSIEEESEIFESCNFNPDLKNYNASDFLRCVADLAVAKSVPEGAKNAQSIPPDELNRFIEALQAKEESSYRFYSRQGPGGYGSYDQVPGAQPFRPKDPAEYQFGGGVYNPEGFQGYPGAYDPYGLSNSALVEALTSISRYDDLKCVPRLLCEISSGSKPGNGYYRASSLENFGKSTLIGLLTSYNFERASPLLGFAKAALLGYTSKDDSSICYKEYQRCPRDSRNLVHYLNNHNGGFFRFFKKSRRSQIAAEGSNRKIFGRQKPAPPPGLSGPESDRTGTGELKFDTSEPSPRQEEKISTVHSRNDGYSKIVFPEENETNNRLQKSLEPDQLPSGFFPRQTSEEKFTQSSFFPSQNDDEENDERISNIVIFKNEEDRYGDSDPRSDKQRPQRASDAESAITFPKNVQQTLKLHSAPSMRQFFPTMERRISTTDDRPST